MEELLTKLERANHLLKYDPTVSGFLRNVSAFFDAYDKAIGSDPPSPTVQDVLEHIAKRLEGLKL